MRHFSDRLDRLNINKKITFPDHEFLGILCGAQNAHLYLLEEKTGVSINVRGNVFLLKGGDWEVDLAEKVLHQLYELIKSGYPLFLNDVDYAVRILGSNHSLDLKKIFMV